MDRKQEQIELEVILQTLNEATTDIERMVKDYAKRRLEGLQDQPWQQRDCTQRPSGKIKRKKCTGMGSK